MMKFDDVWLVIFNAAEGGAENVVWSRVLRSEV